MKNNNFKKVALLCTALASSLGSYAISGGGIAAATIGAAAAVTLLGVGVHKARHRNDAACPDCGYKKCRCNKNSTNSKHKYNSGKKSNTATTKKQLKQDIHQNKKDLKQHKADLKKLERKGKTSTPEAMQHKSMIQELEIKIDEFKRKLESL